jgi:hypothetical protein
MGKRHTRYRSYVPYLIVQRFRRAPAILHVGRKKNHGFDIIRYYRLRQNQAQKGAYISAVPVFLLSHGVSPMIFMLLQYCTFLTRESTVHFQTDGVSPIGIHGPTRFTKYTCQVLSNKSPRTRLTRESTYSTSQNVHIYLRAGSRDCFPPH